MSAIDELCQKLADRGEPVVRNSDMVTWLYYSDPHSAVEAMDGTLQVTGLTPEQAVMATIGRPKAKPEIVSDGSTDGATGYCRCGACGKAIDMWDKFCRWCGTETE